MLFGNYCQKFFYLLLFVGIVLYSEPLHAQDGSKISAEQFKKEKELIEANQKKLKNEKDIILRGKSILEDKYKIYPDEKPCFNIDQIKLIGKDCEQFQSYLDATIKKLDFKNQCIGKKSINSIAAVLNNEIINAGYITTKVIIPSQNLKSGKLELKINTGRIDQILFKSDDRFLPRAKLKKFGAFPFVEGRILNLRDTEQGLENLSKDATSKVDIQIAPSERVNFSDIVIDYKSDKIPIKFQLTADDTGSEATGKCQGGASLYLYNLLSINDMLYGGISKNLSKGTKVYVKTPEEKIDKEDGRVNNFYFGYSFPFGPLLFDYYQNKYQYNQAVAGAYQVYKYSGESYNRSLKASYMVFRDQDSKFSTYIKAWERSSKNFIEDAEVENQRRKTAGYELGLSYKKTYRRASLSLESSLKRGTGARGALRAPEEEFGEGTSRMKIYTLDASYSLPLFKDLPLYYNGSLHVQINGTKLTSQDKISIGGRHSVRGFDGSSSLSSEKGLYVRNTFTYNCDFCKNQIYLGLDAGHVFGKDTKDLAGKTLVGVALGVKGTLDFIGTLSYDLFAGTPLYKPKKFDTKKIALGFSLNYDF